MLLALLLAGQHHKQHLTEEIWGSRGVIVSESNYYKVIRGLRNAFSEIGLDEELIKTIPRVGVCYAGQFQPYQCPSLPIPLSAPHKPASSQFWIKPGLVLLLALLGAVLWAWKMERPYLPKQSYTLIGKTGRFTVFARKQTKVTAEDVIANYLRFNKRSPYHYLYYTNLGNSHSILACQKSEIASECVTLIYKIV